MEFTTITDALLFLRHKTGFAFERRTFARWCEQGFVTIDGQRYLLNSRQVGKLWYVSRASMESIITALPKSENA